MNHAFKKLSEIGLEDYLDQTAGKHNGKTYADFEDLLEIAKHPSGKVNVSIIARTFSVDSRTIDKWIDEYNRSNKK